MDGHAVLVTETGETPFAQLVTAGRHVMRADEPVASGGQDLGPSPYEYMKAALGACTAMTLRTVAQRHGWPVGTISVTTRHEKVERAGQSRIDRFDREITITGELTEEQRLRLAQAAEACPVSLTLRHLSVVTMKLVQR